MTREYLIAGNWKMNLSLPEARTLADDIRRFVDGCADTRKQNVTVAVFPPFVSLQPVVNVLEKRDVRVGAQNCSEHADGAFTGEVSASMIASTGASHVLIGHSERRAMFGDTLDIVAQKVQRAFSAKLFPILCIGETSAQRDAGLREHVIVEQLTSVLATCTDEQKDLLIVAYEPVWAIGSGVAAEVSYIEQTHSMIRAIVRDHGCEVTSRTSILYGGSVSAKNATDIFRIPDVDGALIGGASLRALSFIDILQQAMEATQ